MLEYKTSKTSCCLTAQKIKKTKTGIPILVHFAILRRERDSNPRRCYPQRFSRPPHSTALPSLQLHKHIVVSFMRVQRYNYFYYLQIFQQLFFKYFLQIFINYCISIIFNYSLSPKTPDYPVFASSVSP